MFQGLTPENKADKMTAMMYRFLGNQYTVYAVNRRPGLPPGYTLGDMADDYARVVREAFGGPVDAIGVSTGGSVAVHFAADHPELVRRLVIHSAAHTLNDDAKRFQLEYARLGGSGQWRAASALLVRMAAACGHWPAGSPANWTLSPARPQSPPPRGQRRRLRGTRRHVDALIIAAGCARVAWRLPVPEAQTRSMPQRARSNAADLGPVQPVECLTAAVILDYASAERR